MTTANVSDSTPDEALPRTASIIPFPSRPDPAQLKPEERLAQALASLNNALAEQRIALANWREVLGTLKVTTTGLHGSLQRYRANLQTLGNSVSALQVKARTLEEWADGVTKTGD